MATVATSLFFKFERGSHLCIFYRNDEELLGSLAPYIADGLRNNERCFCVQKPRVAQRLKQVLRAFGIDADREIARRALEIHGANEVYLSTGRFDPHRMVDLLGDAIRGAIAHNFSGLRTAGDLSWFAHGHHDCGVMIEYERMVDRLFPDKPVIGMCQYQITDFSPDVLAQVLGAHQLAFSQTAPASRYHTLSVHWGSYSIDFTGRSLGNAGWDFVILHRTRGILGWGSNRLFDEARIKALSLLPADPPPYAALSAAAD